MKLRLLFETDEEMRRWERAAASGDEDAQNHLLAAQLRSNGIKSRGPEAGGPVNSQINKLRKIPHLSWDEVGGWSELSGPMTTTLGEVILGSVFGEDFGVVVGSFGIAKFFLEVWGNKRLMDRFRNGWDALLESDDIDSYADTALELARRTIDL